MFDRTSLHVALLLWGFIFSLIAALCMFMSKNFDKTKRKLLLALLLNCSLLLFGDALAWEFRGTPGTVAYYVVKISNFAVFFLSDSLLFFYHTYLCVCLFRGKKQIPRQRIIMVYGIAIIGMALVIASQFLNFYYYIDAHNFYHRNFLHPLSMFLPILGMIIDFSFVFQWRREISRQLFISLVSYMVLPLLAMILQTFYYGISLVNIAISISMILLFVVAMIEQNQNLAQKEKEAADLRISIMISQITPHFIYNTLTSIQQLCDTDPKQAEETVGEFAEYLRGNLESLGLDRPVPFERELNHVKSYLAIEKKRFGDRVKTAYNIQEEEFLIPSLTLQPMVENAVKHGLCKKKGGGTVCISTKRDGDYVQIVIQDDGAGFDVNRKMDDGRVHVGIQNVRTRLKDMCDGTLEVSSTPGKGTQVVITLPQK